MVLEALGGVAAAAPAITFSSQYAKYKGGKSEPLSRVSVSL